MYSNEEGDIFHLSINLSDRIPLRGSLSLTRGRGVGFIVKAYLIIITHGGRGGRSIIDILIAFLIFGLEDKKITKHTTEVRGCNFVTTFEQFQ